jgi:DNA-formamidopyrimidine glycosylase
MDLNIKRCPIPEGPEVATMARQLRERLVSERVVDAQIVSGRYQRHGPPIGWQDLCGQLPLTVGDIRVRGKLIHMDLGSTHILSTLGMTGWWSFETGDHHERVRFTTQTGITFSLNDPRNFGSLRVADQEEVERRMGQFGPDLLNEVVPLDVFRKRFDTKRNRKRTIAEALMDQRVVCGIGNYLKAEVLYAARISPWRKVADLADEEIVTLHDSAVQLIRLSYSLGGATIQNYRTPDNEGGLYSRRFAVYGQDADPVGNSVIREKTPEGRTTHWVPQLQR